MSLEHYTGEHPRSAEGKELPQMTLFELFDEGRDARK